MLAIAALVLWVLTAGAGVSLLGSGNAARRRATGPGPADGTQARSLAIPLTDDGKPPPVPRTKVVAPPGEHPLLQFTHPALALTGLGFWLAFTLVHYRSLAWIAFGVLVVTAGAGLGWLTSNTLARRRHEDAARPFPSRLAVLHGLAAAVLALTVFATLLVGHG